MCLTYFQPDAETNSDSMPMMLLGSDDSDEGNKVLIKAPGLSVMLCILTGSCLYNRKQ